MTIINHEFGLTVADARRLAKQVTEVQVGVNSPDSQHWREDFAGISLSRAAFLRSIQYAN